MFYIFVLLTVVLLSGGGAFVWHKDILVSAAGMAAKLACSAVFIGGRSSRDVIENDIMPASFVFQLASVTVDDRRKLAVAKTPGSQDRYAVWRAQNGCVLLAPGDLPAPAGLAQPSRQQTMDLTATGVNGAGLPTAIPARSLRADTATTADPSRAWPHGSATLSMKNWPKQINAQQLERTVERAFADPRASSFSPTTNPAGGPNSRAVLVVHDGRLLLERYAGGFDASTPQLGWSMAKTVLSVLTWTHFSQREVPFTTPAIKLLRRIPQPRWAGEWLRDQRADITLEQLLTMRDGLTHTEGYSVWSDVPRMLFAEGDIGQFAGAAPVDSNSIGTQWRYSSAVSNLLSRVLRDQFTTDRAYWQFPQESLFTPIGARSAVLETDAQGTFVASSFMWASPHDWARLGLLMLNDGIWDGQQVFPAGWLDWARQADADQSGKPGPYGKHVWLTHPNNQLHCPGDVRLPPDGLVMAGHWGQTVALFPSQKVVIVRLGWTIDKSQWNACEFISEVLRSVG